MSVLSLKQLERRAKQYAQRKQLTVDFHRRLGRGIDGAVWPTSRNTAIKVFDRVANYEAERNCYFRLRERSVSEVGIFAIPELLDVDDELMIVEMSIVSPPFIIDFGKADLDRREEYSPEIRQEEEETAREYFGDDWDTVRSAIYRLERYGIFYEDANPRNIMLR